MTTTSMGDRPGMVGGMPSSPDPGRRVLPVDVAGPGRGWVARLAVRGLVSRWGRLALLVALIAGAGWAVTAVGPVSLLRGEVDGSAAGAWAGPAFVVFYAVGTMAFLPKPALSVAAGAVFGLAYGLLLTVSGTVLGALLGFCAGRLLGRGGRGGRGGVWGVGGGGPPGWGTWGNTFVIVSEDAGQAV
ncbi:hypothetical protein ACFV5N_14355, partial [Streptomyces sp. NPDC059853]